MKTMNAFTKQFCRGRMVTILLVLVMAVAIALGSVGVSAYIGAQKQMNKISSGYTTVAIPKQDVGYEGNGKE